MIDLIVFFVSLRCLGTKVKLFHLLVLFVVCVKLLFKLMSNYSLADFVTRIHVASCKFMYTTNVDYTINNLKTLVLLNNEGIVEGFRVSQNKILVFLKYNILNHMMLFKKTKIVSTPGNRQFWSLIKLNQRFSYSNFSGFYLLSTNKGLISSSDALLKYRTSGEILLKLNV